MNENLIIILNLISLTFSACLAIYAYRFKNNPIAYSFFLLMSIFTIWGMLKIVSIYSHSIFVERIVSHTIRAITTFTPGLILYIVIRYTKYPSWFKSSHTKYFFAAPVALALLSFLISIHYFLNEYFGFHLLHIKNYETPGILNIYLFYLYGCLVTSLFILIRNLFKGSYFFNRQLIFILIAIGLPALNDILFRFNISIVPGYHFTPEMFIIGNLFFAWALFGYRFLKLAPITNDLVINSIDDVMITVNCDNLLIDINRSCEQKFNLNTKKEIGEPFSKVFREYPALIDFYEGVPQKEINLSIANKEYCFLAKKSLVNYHKGEPIATIILLHDITENKQAEKQIKEYSKTLEEINETKNKFFSIIAHDLRNPFCVIAGVSDILITEFDNMDKEEFIKMATSIKDTSEKGYTLLQNLLDWARVQTNSIPFEPMEMRLFRIVDSALEVENIIAQKKNITITVNISEDIEVFADFNMINTVLRNLISNAIKFTPRNGAINISAKRLHNDNVEVVVTDNGVGISLENLERIFRIDSKFTTPGTENESGSALGLILCKEFVEKNSGELKVASKIDVGSSFYFTLPERDAKLSRKGIQMHQIISSERA